MFKNIQKQLLLKYPLLWNTKFIPMLIIGVLLNLIYFFIGYADGTLDFTKYYDSDFDFTFFSFSALISLIILILWLVSYFKNNSFKRFYTKSKNALFFEWIQIVIIILLLSMFYFPFEFGKQLHKRNYISEEIAKERCETISSAEFFIDGSFEEAEIDSARSVLNDTNVNGEYKAVERVYLDYVTILGKKYSPYALINRNVAEFSLFSREQDSLRELKIRKFLATNNTFEVKKLMRNYFKILKEHKLLTNLTEDKWFTITYNYPEFKKYELINPKSSIVKENYTEPYSKYDYGYAEPDKTYSTYYIEHNILKDNYRQISGAYTSSVFQLEPILVLFYCVFGFSMLIFSFRVTSGKSWLIALVSYGIFNIVIGIISGVLREFLTYPIIVIISFLVVVGLFFSVVIAKKTKSKTMVLLNLIIWLFGGFIPTVYLTYMESYQNRLNAYLENMEYYNDPHYIFLKDNMTTMFCLNIVFIFAGMFFMSRVIRTWKGISEE
ncbi:hypothetical protein G6N05_02120 [Flavobacterium sp. F372]|uniref:ABC transporter permease n=1 Tax=Flavobacterium bernardetii TaxID=2813823 RepID=A0ABR7IVW7_9FLAO|nr:hypothetical protein [Flavobacterium bernardetii]MBC5833672.1 hypothetical protein [Flavobacterium bernardetii]NHF68905.1 hypothetical protein [Flavobacterium bernardetii]